MTDSAVARLVALHAELIDTACTEALDEIGGLSTAVLDSARHAGALLSTVNGRGAQSDAGEVQASAQSESLLDAVRRATIHLQFADRLQQRLSNVSKCLADIAKLMQSIDLPISMRTWNACLEETRATYTMDQERHMFDAIFNPSILVIGAQREREKSQGPILFDTESGNEDS